MLLGPQKPAQCQPKQASEQEELNTLPSPEEVLVTLRLQVDSCGPSDVSALIQILLGGTSIRCRNHHLWIHAVRDHFHDVPLCVPNCQLLRFVCVTAPQHGCKVCLVTLDGGSSNADLEGLTQGSVPFPEGGVHVHIRPADTEVSGTAGEGPQLVNIDCTGLGGHDLGGFKDYDICLRTDKHSQSIYGPSVTPLESPGRDGVHQVTLVALGGSKAMQEFLVLHYLATDSAREWDVFLDSCLPECTWVRAGPRRALALHMCDKCHIAPSHRRFAHPSWIAGMKLMLDLLLGARKHRYLGRCLAAPRPTEVYVRGFSAGSYSGICLLHLLWNMPHVQVGGILGGISCPPALIHGISPEHGESLKLIHLTTDRLCQWHPYDKTLRSLNCKYCIVDRTTQELKELFGSCEHSYGHWIDISLPHGRYPLNQLLRRFSDVAPPQARDIAPLRLVSCVSCEVPDHVQHFLNQLMVLFGAVAPVSSDEVLAIGAQQLGVTSSGEISWDAVRDALIKEITFGGAKCPTEEVCRLLADFLQRLPLPRLVHFLDMILPQMVPVQSPCQSRRRRFASSYRVAERAAGGEWDVGYTLNVTKLYWSRSGIMHVAIAWDHKPLLLLATALFPNRTTASFESEAGPPYDKQRIQMGLRSGNTVLISFRSGVGHFQCVLIALSADLHTNKQWQGQHKFWKYVSPLRTYFAWLPERLARTYCSAALDKCSEIPYGEVHHLQGRDEDEKHSFVFQNIYHIGDTKSAQELEVFLRMSRERLRLCCGLQCTDRLHPNGPRQRQKLYTAALKLLWFAVGIDSVQCENAAQAALHAAIWPLLRLEDGHVLATLSAIVLALCEGRVLLTFYGFEESDWPQFLHFVKCKLSSWHAHHVCASMESCSSGVLHCHLMLQFMSATHRQEDDFCFRAFRPNASTTDLCGEGLCRRQWQRSVDRGFFYVYADKIGTVQKASGDVLTEGNYLPCWTSSERNYQVLGKWPETLWKQRKISTSVYERYLYLSRDGVVSRHRNLTLCREQEQRLEAEAAVQERIKRIRGNPELFQPFPEIPSARNWLQQFEKDALRYPILIVLGPSRKGKTEWAKSLFKHPLELKVGSLTFFPDSLRAFKRGFHDGLILDDLRDLQFVVDNQEKLQRSTIAL